MFEATLYIIAFNFATIYYLDLYNYTAFIEEKI